LCSSFIVNLLIVIISVIFSQIYDSKYLKENKKYIWDKANDPNWERKQKFKKILN